MSELDPNDMLEQVWKLQTDFMEELKSNDKMPEWPVDLTSKPGQRLVKETIFNMMEELMEASYTLKNRMHRLTDARLVDMDHFREEIGDAFAYFLEVCILSGLTPTELFNQFKKKNAVVFNRLKNGY